MMSFAPTALAAPVLIMTSFASELATPSIKDVRRRTRSQHGWKMSPVLQPYCNRVTRPYNAYNTYYTAVCIALYVRTYVTDTLTRVIRLCKISCSSLNAYDMPQMTERLNNFHFQSYCVRGDLNSNHGYDLHITNSSSQDFTRFQLSFLFVPFNALVCV